MLILKEPKVEGLLWKRKTLCEMNFKWVSWAILQIRLKQDEQKFKVLEWSHSQAERALFVRKAQDT